jgi:hypothetical protein
MLESNSQNVLAEELLDGLSELKQGKDVFLHSQMINFIFMRRVILSIYRIMALPRRINLRKINFISRNVSFSWSALRNA